MSKIRVEKEIKIDYTRNSLMTGDDTKEQEMREKWIVETKKGDFNGLSREFGVSPLVVRCMVNRGLTDREEMRQYLYGTLEDLHDPFLMKDMEKAVTLIKEAREKNWKVAIASDFDCDGIFCGYILWKGLTRL